MTQDGEPGTRYIVYQLKQTLARLVRTAGWTSSLRSKVEGDPVVLSTGAHYLEGLASLPSTAI